MYKTREEVEIWLLSMAIENYVINKDLTVDVNGNVDISNGDLDNIPIQFRMVFGTFNCNYNELSNLKGCPKYINGSFFCIHNKLTSLEGCPEEINGGFYCSFNNLTSLKVCPEIIAHNFNCNFNKLTSLEGCPKKVYGHFYCSENFLTNLEGLFFICGDLYCESNKINDLSHLNINKVKDVYLSKNKIVECNWLDSVEDKSLFSRILSLFSGNKKIDLSNNNINENGLLSLKNANNKIVIRLTNNKGLYLSEDYNNLYLNLFNLKNNLSTYQDKKIVAIKDELNVFKNEIRDEFEGEKIIKKRKL